MTATSLELHDRASAAATGAERVALAEHFYWRAFAGALAFVGLSGAAAIAILPLRNSAADVPLSTPTVVVTALLVLITPAAVAGARQLYRLLRRRPVLELVPVALAAALLAYPLRSELWWPACALVMLVAIPAPLGRTWAYCVAVLVTNLLAHVVHGDLPETPAVAILGLWIGFGFWATLTALLIDRIGSHLLRRALVFEGPEPEPAVGGDPDETVTEAQVVETRALPAPRLQRLTGRQLEVVALLAQGLRYDAVAASLSISRRQVQRHVREAVQRLEVANANELVAVAIAEGLVPRQVQAR